MTSPTDREEWGDDGAPWNGPDEGLCDCCGEPWDHCKHFFEDWICGMMSDGSCSLAGVAARVWASQWRHRNSDYDIIAYRVETPNDH